MRHDVDQTVEIKARCTDMDRIRNLLSGLGARLMTVETQTDTFYNAADGRLKLRRSRSGNLLIGYHRPDLAGPKHCLLGLYETSDAEGLDKALSRALGIRAVVRKEREIFIQGNVKIHLDQVETLGSFLEIEVLGHQGLDSVESLRSICEEYMERLDVKPGDLVQAAYVDLLEKSLDKGDRSS